MRIIAGKFRGTRLASLGKGDVKAHLRPTSDRVRESVFSILTARMDFDGIAVLDLFAGTGALGLEALSRGARHVTFVENGRVGAGLITDNVSRLNSVDRTTLLRKDATRLDIAPHPFDLVFLDPPYGQNLGTPALNAVREGGWLGPDAAIVWEEAQSQSLPQGFRQLDARRYGDTYITLLTPEPI